LLLAEVYSAGEAPLAGFDARALCAAIRARGKVNPIFVEDIEQLENDLQSIVQNNDVVLTLGAGSIGKVASTLQEKLIQQA
jgi:UDP-N-acetylmuramate--alanine ligase